MINPSTELREYLERLIHRLLNAKAIQFQLKLVNEWTVPRAGRRKALMISGFFFELATYSMSRTVLVEMAMLLSDREDRSIRDWLEKAAQHAQVIAPKRYNKSTGFREQITASVYRKIIDEHVQRLNKQSTVINNIKARRDKVITHLDKKYFNDPNAAFRDIPLSDEELDCLVEEVSSILREHYSYLFEVSLAMEYQSIHNVDQILEYSRAWQRLREDSEAVMDKGVWPVFYVGDNPPKEKK